MCAWFSMNNKVTATGMEVKATVSDSLLIASSTEGTSKSPDSAFTKGINQAVTATLQPVSTISGAKDSFYYTYDAKADGSKATAVASEPYIAVPTTGTDPYTVDDGTSTPKAAFVDYVFEIKAINANAADKYLRLTKLNLLYDGAALTEHSYRIAVLSQEEGGSGYADLATTTAADKIFAYTGFTYFDGTAVSGTATKAAVSPTVNTAGWEKTVPGRTTKFYKVTVRLWLEGEDTDCYTEKFVSLTNIWSLDLAFELVETAGTAASTAIGTVPNQAATASGATGTVTFNMTGETAVDYKWYKQVDFTTATEAGTGASFSINSAAEDGYYYCEITTAKGTQYRTNSVKLTYT